MSTIHKVLCAAFLSLVLAVPTMAQDTSSTASTASTAGVTADGMATTGSAGAQLQQVMAANFDRLFMLKAAQGNAAEVMTSQLALQKSKNPRVRQLAQMLVMEHGTAQRELLPLLTAKALPTPRQPGTMQIATFQMLSKLKGNNFDQQYMAAQVEAHEAAIALYQNELAMGTDEAARAYATKYLPHILGHTALIYAVAGEVKAPGSAERMTALRTDMATMTALGNQALSEMQAMMRAQMNGGAAMKMDGAAGSR